MVDPGFQRLGIGRDLVRTVTDEAFRAGCHWVHVDYEPEYASFYERACGFRPTSAGLARRAGAVTARPPPEAPKRALRITSKHAPQPENHCVTNVPDNEYKACNARGPARQVDA